MNNENCDACVKVSATREKIIQSASALIGMKGIEGTSLADIARDACISKGTLYYYYSTKNSLIFDIADAHMNRISGELFQMIETHDGAMTWKGMLKQLLETLIQSETRSRLHLYLVREAISGNGRIRERFRKTYTHWFQMIEDAYCQMTGEERKISAQAMILVASIDGFIIQSMLDVEPVSVDDIVEKLALIVFADHPHPLG